MGAMTFEAATNEEMASQGAYLKAPGWFLFKITEIDEQPVSKEGKAIDGIKASMIVAAGPEADKRFDLYVKSPNTGYRDGGKFASKIRTSFALASGLMKEEQLGGPVTIDPQQAVERMVVAQIDHQKDNNDGKPTQFMELSYDNVFHIDSPRVASVGALDPKVISLLPATHRRDPKSFKLPRDAAPGTATTAAGQKNSQPASGANDDLGGI